MFIDVFYTVISIEIIEPFSDFAANDLFEGFFIVLVDITDKRVTPFKRYRGYIFDQNSVIIFSDVPVLEQLVQLEEFDPSIVKEEDRNDGKGES